MPVEPPGGPAGGRGLAGGLVGGADPRHRRDGTRTVWGRRLFTLGLGPGEYRVDVFATGGVYSDTVSFTATALEAVDGLVQLDSVGNGRLAAGARAVLFGSGFSAVAGRQPGPYRGRAGAGGQLDGNRADDRGAGVLGDVSPAARGRRARARGAGVQQRPPPFDRSGRAARGPRGRRGAHAARTGRGRMRALPARRDGAGVPPHHRQHGPGRGAAASDAGDDADARQHVRRGARDRDHARPDRRGPGAGGARGAGHRRGDPLADAGPARRRGDRPLPGGRPATGDRGSGCR